MTSVPPNGFNGEPDNSQVPPGYEQPLVPNQPPSFGETPYQPPNYPQPQQYQQPQQPSYPQQMPYQQPPFSVDPFLAYPGSEFKGGNPYGTHTNYALGSREALAQPLYGANPAQAVGRFFKKYATFSGRASLSEYWWTVLFVDIAFIVLFILVATANALGPASRTSSGDDLSVLGGMGLAVMVILFLGLVVPLISLSVRRLHDADLSGGLYFLNFIPYVGGFIVLILNVLPSKPSGARFDPWIQSAAPYINKQMPPQQYPGQF